jgi:uncharacterized protein YegJ (DUF2314 family)
MLITGINILVFLTISMVACQTRPKESDASTGEMSAYSIEEDDQEMNHAIEEARNTLPQFTEAFTSNNPNHTLFALKMMFQDQVGGFEHIWITDLAFDDGAFRGLVGNIPEYTIEVEAGEEVRVDPEKISDWMYVDNGVLRGGFTLRVLRSRMSPQEREQFDSEIGFGIED